MRVLLGVMYCFVLLFYLLFGFFGLWWFGDSYFFGSGWFAASLFLISGASFVFNLCVFFWRTVSIGVYFLFCLLVVLNLLCFCVLAFILGFGGLFFNTMYVALFVFLGGGLCLLKTADNS